MAANNQRFEQLKQKYQSVTNAMWQLPVRLENVNMQGDKLFIRGEAPSQEAKLRRQRRLEKTKQGRYMSVAEAIHSGHRESKTGPPGK